MNRIIHILFAVVLVGVAAPARVAFADEPAPSKDQLEQAKVAFREGAKLYDDGKFADAIVKFKESYKLSRNPVLLYNIGHALDQAGDKQKALFYFRKFLADAPKDAKQRKEVTKRVDEIEKENFEDELNGTSTPASTPTTTNNATTTTTKPEETHAPVKIKPAGTYQPTEFQHQVIDSAPPGKPLDVSAFVPEDSGWTVTLYYRGAGEAKFVAKPMRWRYKELIGRIPGSKINGSSIQYYVEVKDQAGNVVTRSGKSTSPNLVNVDASTPPRFYPDVTDDSEPVAGTPVVQRHGDDEDDPLHKHSSEPIEQTPINETPGVQGNGFSDVGSSKFNKAKWISTGLAGALIGGAIVSYILASGQASNLTADRDGRGGATCETPPCYAFDSYDLDVQSAGERYNTIHRVTLVTGVIAAGIAGYFWYRELTAKKHGETRTVGRNKNVSPEWAIAPAIGEGFAGAAAAASF